MDLLNAVSPECFEELIPKGTESSIQYEGYDMSCIEVMTNFLQYRLEGMDVSARQFGHTVLMLWKGLNSCYYFNRIPGHP